MEGPSDEAFWAFFWEGQLFDVHVKNEQIEQDADGNIIEERKILSIGNLHKCARDDRRQFAEDLTDAFTASCRGALVIPYSTYELLLAFPVL